MSTQESTFVILSQDTNPLDHNIPMFNCSVWGIVTGSLEDTFKAMRITAKHAHLTDAQNLPIVKLEKMLFETYTLEIEYRNQPVWIVAKSLPINNILSYSE